MYDDCKMFLVSCSSDFLEKNLLPVLPISFLQPICFKKEELSKETLHPWINDQYLTAEKELRDKFADNCSCMPVEPV